MTMRSKLIHLLLLITLAFNIAHASIIASHDDCHHEIASEYVLEQSDSQDCHDLCDIHHLFHMTAIITPTVTFVNTVLSREIPSAELVMYHPSFKETENKPPIA